MRYFIYLQYDGSNYHGWQIQPNAVSVQQTLQRGLSLLLRRETLIVGAGRTDTGVHAREMIAHMDLPGLLSFCQGRFDIIEQTHNDSALCAVNEEPTATSLRETIAACQHLTQKLTLLLPQDIAILRIIPVRPDAHARFSPISRTYRYYITTRKDPFARHYTHRVTFPLDFDAMNAAAALLPSFTDFTSFSKLHTDVKTNDCRIFEARWVAGDNPDEWHFVIRADRFLRGMVRAVVGTLLLVGRHRLTLAEFRAVIERRDRCAAGDSAPAEALFLENVEYPESIFYDENVLGSLD